MKNLPDPPDYVLKLFKYWERTEDEGAGAELYFIGKEIGAW